MSEYWVKVDLEDGDLEKLEQSDEIMDECESHTDGEYISGTFDNEDEAKRLYELIEALG